MRLRFLSLVVLLFASVAAYADTVSLTLLNATQSITTAGGLLSFNATVSAPGSNLGSENLDFLTFNLNPQNSFTISADPFLNGYPLALAPGDSYTGTLFTVNVPTNSTAQSYTGSVTLYGGPSDGLLSTKGFTINVNPSVAVTPEPSSLLLLGTGLVGMATAFRRRFAAPVR